MLHRRILAANFGGIFCLVTSSASLAQGFDPASIARQTSETVRSMICPGATFSFADLGDPELNRMDPARIFDNLYLLGMKSTAAWALSTTEGIVLFESMHDYTVEDYVIGHLVRLGLDPADIKYVIVSHAHADHYGGTKHLQDAYGARIVMSVQDWQHMHSSERLGADAPPGFPRFDIAAQDGSTITLGDTTIRLIHTPGHTPGTLSAIFPVRDGNEIHYVGYLGGSGVPRSPGDIVTFMGSLDRLAYIDSRIDVGLSNHPFADGTLIKLEALNGRRAAGDPHPFVIGNAAYRQWLSVIHDCAGEVLAQMIAENASQRAGERRSR